MRNALLQNLDQIAQVLCKRVENSPPNIEGLYSGDFGVLLFLIYYSKYFSKPGLDVLSESLAEKLLEELGNCNDNVHTIANGISGILFLFNYLEKNENINIDISEAEEILNNFIVRLMRQDFKNEHFDLLHGALGVGYYFLTKGSSDQYVQECIDFLYNISEKDRVNNIFKWKSVLKTPSVVDISLSHGISSIILFLCKSIRKGIQNNKIKEMLTGAVNYILSQEQDVDIHGSFFPTFSKEHPDYSSFTKSRLGWCYGDLGIAYSLWNAGVLTKNKKWEEKGLDILKHSTSRTILSDKNVFDAGICHGSVGIAMIFRRMYIETDMDIFSSATNYWIEKTINFLDNVDFLGKKRAIHTWDNEIQLLTGISGIGLMLLSYLSNDDQRWDTIFLLS